MYHSFLGGVLFLFVYPQQENIIVSFGSVEWNQNPWYFQKAPCHPGVALASHPSTIELSCQVMAWLKLGKLYELYVSNKSHSQWFKIDVLKASSSCEMLEAMMADSLSPQMQKRLGEKLPFNQKKTAHTNSRKSVWRFTMYVVPSGCDPKTATWNIAWRSPPRRIPLDGHTTSWEIWSLWFKAYK